MRDFIAFLFIILLAALGALLVQKLVDVQP